MGNLFNFLGGQIHDVHLSFIRQYMDVSSPLDIVLACGMNNVPTTDTPDDVILQFESFLMSISNHSERYQHTNRYLIKCFKRAGLWSLSVFKSYFKQVLKQYYFRFIIE